MQRGAARKKVLKGCALLFLVLLVGAGIFFGPALRDFYRNGFFDDLLHPQKERLYRGTTEKNLRALYTALMLYHDSEGVFPESGGWMDAISNRLQTSDMKEGEGAKKFLDPATGKPGFAMNDAVAGKYKGDIKDPHTIVLFQATGGVRNAHGDPKVARKGMAITLDGTLQK